MSEQQSQKRGVVSDAQKTERARDGYAPIPPGNPVAGALGESERHPTDQDTALQQIEKNSAGEKRESQS
jgi:hypothetical protein